MEELTFKIQKTIQESLDSNEQLLIDKRSVFSSIIKKIHSSRFCPSRKITQEIKEKLKLIASQNLHDKSDAAIIATLLQEQKYISATNILKHLEIEEKETLSEPSICNIKRSRSQSLSTTLALTQKYSNPTLLNKETNKLQLTKKDMITSIEQTAHSLMHLVNYGKLSPSDLKNELKKAQKTKTTVHEATQLLRSLTRLGLFGSLTYKKCNTSSIFKLVNSAPKRTLVA